MVLEVNVLWNLVVMMKAFIIHVRNYVLFCWFISFTDRIATFVEGGALASLLLIFVVLIVRHCYKKYGCCCRKKKKPRPLPVRYGAGGGDPPNDAAHLMNDGKWWLYVNTSWLY